MRGFATGVSIALDVKTMSNPNESSFKKEMAAISMAGTVIGSTCNPAIGVGTAIVTIGGSMLYDTVPDGGKKILDKIAEGKPSVYSTNLNKVEASKSRKRGATSNANRNRKSTKKTVAVANRKKPPKVVNVKVKEISGKLKKGVSNLVSRIRNKKIGTSSSSRRSRRRR